MAFIWWDIFFQKSRLGWICEFYSELKEAFKIDTEEFFDLFGPYTHRIFGSVRKTKCI
jgi:hypothetical protein